MELSGTLLEKGKIDSLYLRMDVFKRRNLKPGAKKSSPEMNK